MSKIVTNIDFFLNSDSSKAWENTTEADRKALLRAIQIVKHRKIAEIVSQSMSDSTIIREQFEVAMKHFEQGISKLEKKIEDIEEAESLVPVLETAPEVSLDLSIAAQKAKEEQLKRETDAKNKSIINKDAKRKKELATKKRLLKTELSRLLELRDSFEQSFSDFIQRACGPSYEPEELKGDLINTLAISMANGGGYAMESVGNNREPIFNHEGDGYSTGYSLNVEAAKKFVKALNDEVAVQTAADLVRADQELETCEKRKKEIETRREELKKTDSISESDIAEVKSHVDSIRDNAQELISNSTAIANRSTFDRFLSKIRQMLSIKGTTEKRNEELIAQMKEMAKAHMDEIARNPNYEQAAKFYIDSLKTYRKDERSEVQFGEEAMRQSLGYLKACLSSQDLESFESDESVNEGLEQLVEMACLSTSEARTESSKNVAIQNYRNYEKEKERIPISEEINGQQYDEARISRDIAQEAVNKSEKAKEIYDNNKGETILNWVDKYLNMSKRNTGIHGPAALLALRAVLGVDDEEIINNLANITPENIEKINEHVKQAEGKVQKAVEEALKEADSYTSKADLEI